MPGKILGIDISRHAVTAVQVASGFKGYRITSGSRIVLPEDGGLDRALGELSRSMDLKSDTCIATLPEDHVSYRNIILPFKEPKKIKQILPFEIETLVPFSIEDLIIDHMILDQSEQSEVLVVSTTKKHISEYLSVLRTYGVNPDILEIRPVPMASWLLDREGTPKNGLLLHIDLIRNSMVLFLERKIVLIRSFVSGSNSVPPSMNDEILYDQLTSEKVETILKSFCKKVQNTMHSFGWQTRRTIHPEKVFFTGMGVLYSDTAELLHRFLGVPAERIHVSGDTRVLMDKHVSGSWNPETMDTALSIALRESKKGRGFNLRKGEFEIEKPHLGHLREIRKAVALLILILLFLSFDLGVEYSFLKRRYETAEQRSVELFRRTFPDVQKVRYPVLQMKQKIDETMNSSVLLPGEIRTDQKVLDLLNDISRRIPESLNIDITNMVVDSETVRISGDTDTYDTVDNVKNNLEPSDYFDSVVISSATQDRSGKKVNFEIKIERAK